MHRIQKTKKQKVTWQTKQETRKRKISMNKGYEDGSKKSGTVASS